MMHHMAEEHEREDFVHANASTYRLFYLKCFEQTYQVTKLSWGHT